MILYPVVLNTINTDSVNAHAVCQRAIFERFTWR